MSFRGISVEIKYGILAWVCHALTIPGIKN